MRTDNFGSPQGLTSTAAPDRIRCRLWLAPVLLICLTAGTTTADVLQFTDAELAGNADVDVPPSLAALQDAFQQVVDQVAPAVVGIRARRRYLAPAPDGELDLGSVEQLVVINGSGTIIRDDGFILTNEHVVRGAWEIEVILHDGRSRWASVVAADARADLAIIRIDADGLQRANIASWSGVRRGQWNLAIGNPYGLGADGKLSVSVGVISNLGRRLPGLGEVDDRLYADMIQTTAMIHPGNSGGPLFNIDGELIGVITAVHARGADDEGVGFAIPMNPPRRAIVERLLEGRPISYGYLGLTVRALEPEEAALAKLEPGVGVLIEKVEPGGPADNGGVRVNDVLVHFEGDVITAPMQLAEQVGLTAVGKRVELDLRRDGKPLKLRVKLERRQINRVNWMRGASIQWRGMRVAPLDESSRARLDVAPDTNGVIILDVAKDSPADAAQLRTGNIILRIDDEAIPEPAIFLEHISQKPGEVRLEVQDRGPVRIRP